MLVKPIWEFIKQNKVLTGILIVLLFVFIFDTFFRYEYKFYNMNGRSEYRVKAVRLDKLTGKCELIILYPKVEQDSGQNDDEEE